MPDTTFMASSMGASPGSSTVPEMYCTAPSTSPMMLSHRMIRANQEKPTSVCRGRNRSPAISRMASSSTGSV